MFSEIYTYGLGKITDGHSVHISVGKSAQDHFVHLTSSHEPYIAAESKYNKHAMSIAYYAILVPYQHHHP